MKTKSLCIAFASLLLGSQSSFGQGGPYVVDQLIPRAWPNPAVTLPVEPEETLWVASRAEVEQKQKYYFVFGDESKESGTIEGGYISSHQHMAYLKWDDPNDGDENYFICYPSEAGYDTLFDAIPLTQLDPRCFQSFNGPYSHLVDNPFYVGQVSGFPWVAFSGLMRPMGGDFSAAQISKIIESNKSRPDHNSTMKSDLRAALVNEFLELHPDVAIPIDTVGNTLNDNPNSDSYAVVCHILPRIAPDGNGCGRNALRNALLVSKAMKKGIEQAGFPSDGFIMYCEWLAARYNKGVPLPTPPKSITVQTIRDLSQLSRMDVEYLEEEETKTLLEYVQNSKRR